MTAPYKPGESLEEFDFTHVSLFCGGGGESVATELAKRRVGLVASESYALNHWPLAIDVHACNLPHVKAYESDITKVTASTYGLKVIQLLWASPSCVHHSRARGGKPRDDQERSHPHEIVERWLRPANVRVFLMENVVEVIDWGPLHKDHSHGCEGGEECAKGCHFNQPIKERKGEYFRAFLKDLESCGYVYDWTVLCAADYGDPTKRKRFFLQAVKDGRPITWPAPTHRNPKQQKDLFDTDLPAWRTAAECIDWSIPCPSIFGRKKPLAEKTLRRIAAGLDRFVIHPKAGVRPYIVNLTHGGRVEDVDEPFNTITGAHRGEKAIVSGSLVQMAHGGRVEDVNAPLNTVATEKGGSRALATAHMVNLRGTTEQHLDSSSSGADEPLRTISAGGKHQGIVAASLIQYHDETSDNARVAGLTEPLATVDTANRHALVEAYLVKHNLGVVGNHVEEPLSTVTARDSQSLAAVTLINTRNGEREGQAPRTFDVDEPMPTVTAQGSQGAVVEAELGRLDEATLEKGYRVAAFIMQYFGTDNFGSPDEPLSTATAKARHALVTVVIDGETYIIVDIGMRMLRPRELARAMGFPEWYKFEDAAGKPMTIEAQVKMIGNACPVNTVSALIENILRPRMDEYRVAA